MGKVNSITRRILFSGLFKSLSFYTIASFANAAIPFLLLPVLTTRLTPVDYGIITMFATVQGFLLPILGVNLEGAVVRKFYSNDTDLGLYIGNCLLISFSSTLVCFSLIYFFKGVISNYTKIPEEWILLIPVACVAQFLCTLALSLWQVKERPLKYATFQILQSFVNATLTIVLIICFSYNWPGRILAIVFSTIVFAIYGVFSFWKQNTVKIRFNLPYIKHALNYGGGLVPHAIGGMLILVTNRLFLTKMVSIEESGIYGVAAQVCSVITFLTVSFNNAYVPWLFKKLAGNEYHDRLKVVRLTYVYFIVILVFGFLYYLFLPYIFKYFVGIKFLSALDYCFWIILGLVFQGMYFMVTNYINFAEKTHIQALLTISVGIVNIPLNYICILYFGGVGAAISFALIFFLFFGLTWLLSSKIYPMPWLEFNSK